MLYKPHTTNSKKLMYAGSEVTELSKFVLMFYISFNKFSVNVGKFSCLPASRQDLAEDKVSCSRTQHNASGLELVTL